MKRFINFIQVNLVQPFLRSFKRFPETVSLGLFMMILANINILIGHLDFEILTRDILDAAWLVLFYYAAWTLLIERFHGSNKVRYFGDGIILALGVLYYFLAPTAATPFIEGTRYSGLLLIGILSFLVAPYFFRREGFSLYTLYVGTKFLVTVFYSLVLWGGLSLILASIEGLFQITIDYRVYSLIIITIQGLVTLPVFLGLVPSKEETLTPELMNKIWKTVFSVIVLPLVLIFTVILLVYILTSLVPNSTYVSMVYLSSSLLLAIAGTLTLFFLDPVKQESAHIQFFFRFWPFALLLVFGGFYYELIRDIIYNINGFSISHAFFLLSGIYPPSVAIVYILKLRRRLIYTLLMAMDTALLVTLVPYVNAISITRYSLNNELDTLLRTNDMWVNEAIVANADLPLLTKNQFSSIINRSYEVGLQSLNALPEGFELEDFETVFGFEFTVDWTPEKSTVFYNYALENDFFELDTVGYDAVLFYPRLDTGVTGDYVVSYNLADFTLIVSSDDLHVIIDLVDIANQLKELESIPGDHEMLASEMNYSFTEEGDTVTIAFHQINFTYDIENDNYLDFYADFIIAVDAN